MSLDLIAVVGAVAAILAGIFGYGRFKMKEGEQKGREDLRRRAQAAGEARKEQRNEIDEDIGVGGPSDARNSLRDDWSNN